MLLWVFLLLPGASCLLDTNSSAGAFSEPQGEMTRFLSLRQGAFIDQSYAGFLPLKEVLFSLSYQLIGSLYDGFF